MIEIKRRSESINTDALDLYLNNCDNSVALPYDPVSTRHAQIAQGDGANNRTGRQVMITRIKGDYWIALDGAKSLPSFEYGFPIRMITFVCRNNNGRGSVNMEMVQRLFAQVDAVSEYALGTAVYAPVPPDAREEFVVLNDVNTILKPANPINQTAMPTEVTLQPNTQDSALVLSYDLKVNVLVTYGSYSSPNTNSPVTNAIYTLFTCPFMPYAANVPVAIEAWPKLIRSYQYTEFHE